MRGLKLFYGSYISIVFKSHLLQMRGLKPNFVMLLEVDPIVASFTDAWIETVKMIMKNLPLQSHLLQMRGLKLVSLAPLEPVDAVASFTDAWIETILNLTISVTSLSHLLQMRGLKLNRESNRT